MTDSVEKLGEVVRERNVSCDPAVILNLYGPHD
jgi:hypothetical protein